jgi:hypothetical protein
VTREALRDVTQEERQLREYTLVMRAAAAQAELASRLDSAFFGVYPI